MQYAMVLTKFNISGLPLHVLRYWVVSVLIGALRMFLYSNTTRQVDATMATPEHTTLNE